MPPYIGRDMIHHRAYDRYPGVGIADRESRNAGGFTRRFQVLRVVDLWLPVPIGSFDRDAMIPCSKVVEREGR